MKPQTPNPNEADLHAMNILIESAASEQTSIEADAISHAIVAERQPSVPTEISILWQRETDGRVFTYNFDAVMFLVDRFQDLGKERDAWRESRDHWRCVALAWPWVCAGLVFGWALSLWMVMHG